ncbi:MAG: 1-aminocyclopropane-1-carboxylate deaminase/D-cysteine desulfhydrase [Bacteroidota bacterium]
MLQHQFIPIQKVTFPDSDISNVFVLRLDAIDLNLGGNKFFKLLFNIDEVKKENHQTIITFGGSFSNHLAAFASLKSQFPEKRFIAMVRGDESMVERSITLARLRKLGVEINFVHSQLYRDLCENFNHEFFNQFENRLILPEGGSNQLAVKGCEKIADLIPADYNHVVLPIATGATMAGIVRGANSSQAIHGIAVLKAVDYLQNNLEQFLANSSTNKIFSNYKIHDGYHHGGYAKVPENLIRFVSDFNQLNDFEIEPIYTGKMFWAIYDMVTNGFFSSNDNLLAIHTGGLQYLHID